MNHQPHWPLCSMPKPHQEQISRISHGAQVWPLVVVPLTSDEQTRVRGSTALSGWDTQPRRIQGRVLEFHIEYQHGSCAMGQASFRSMWGFRKDSERQRQRQRGRERAWGNDTGKEEWGESKKIKRQKERTRRDR